jgi:hypothetical protein
MNAAFVTILLTKTQSGCIAVDEADRIEEMFQYGPLFSSASRRNV